MRLATAAALALLTAPAVIAAPPALAAETASADKPSDLFTREDVFQLEYADDPQISPDGARVAYVRTALDIMTDAPRGNIWVVNTGGGRHRPLFSGPKSYSSPRWSPTGDRLAYVASEDGRGAEIHVRWMDTGQTAMLTNIPRGPGALSWSPDGTQIAFTMFVPAEGDSLVKPMAKPDGAKWAPPAKLIDQVYYRFDGAGYLEQGYTQIFVVPADGGTARQITFGNHDSGGPLAWSKDGSKIYFSTNRDENADYEPQESEIWSVALNDGAMKKLTDRNGPDSAPTLSPDGTHIAYLGFDDDKRGYDNAHLYVMNTDGRNSRNLTPDFDRSIAAVSWIGNDALIVQYDDHGRTYLGRIAASGGEITPLVRDLGGLDNGRPYTSGAFTAASNGSYAYTSGRADRPADIAAATAGKDPIRLTRLNDDLFGHKTLAAVEDMSWKSSADGRDIQGWVMKPPHFDASKKYPMILEIHGGPFAAYGPQFSAEDQLYAAAGYVVLYANPRGSTSYGDEFANLIDRNYPSQDYDDLMSGVDALIAKGYVDKDELFVTGGSGGGVLTAWIVGKTNRFRAAVVQKPVINWISFVLTSDAYPFFEQYWFDKMPWENLEAYWKRSPLAYVGNVTTPTMLVTGEADHRTPSSEAEQFYQALKLRKIDTAMVRIPEASHHIAARPSHMISKVDYVLGWFEKYRGDKKDGDGKSGK